MKIFQTIISHFIIVSLASISLFGIFTFSASLFIKLNFNHLYVFFILSAVISYLLAQKLGLSKLIIIDNHVIISFVVVIIPSITYFLQNTNFNTSPHFDGHFSHIQDVLIGNIPPNSVFAYGIKNPTYWCYHVLLALIVKVTGIQAAYSFQLLNIFGIFMLLSFLQSILHFFNVKTKWNFILILLIPFSMNLLGGIVYVIKFLIHGKELISDNLYTNLDYFSTSYQVPIQYKDNIHKFYSFNSISLAYSFLFFNLLMILNLSKGNYKLYAYTFLGLSIGFVYHPTVMFIPAIVSFLILVFNLFNEKQHIKNKIILDVIGFIVINTLFVMYALFGLQSFGENNVSLTLFHSNNWFFFAYTLLPNFICLLIVLFYSTKRVPLIIYIYTLISLGLSLTMSIKLHNQYKFSYLFAMLTVLIFIVYWNNIKNKSVKNVFLIGLTLLIFLKLFIVEFHFTRRYLADKNYYRVENREINSYSSEEQEIIDWLREKNTSHRLMLIIPPNMKRIRMFVTCARVKLYARNSWIFTDSPEFSKRFDNCNIIYNNRDLNKKKSTLKNIVEEFREMEVLLFVPNNEENFKGYNIFKLSGNFKLGKFYQLK